MMIVIRTQYRENYGTESEPYWKFKGGYDYKVTNVPTTASTHEVVDTVRSKVDYIEYEGPMSEQYILDWSVEDDGYLSEFEQSQLEYDGAILYPEPTIDYKEIVNV